MGKIQIHCINDQGATDGRSKSTNTTQLLMQKASSYEGFSTIEATHELLAEWQDTHHLAKLQDPVPRALYRYKICFKLYTLAQRRSHKYFHGKRGATKSQHLIDKVGLYRCKVEGCKFPLQKVRGKFTQHLLEHSKAELVSVGLSQFVKCLLQLQLIQQQASQGDDISNLNNLANAQSQRPLDNSHQAPITENSDALVQEQGYIPDQSEPTIHCNQSLQAQNLWRETLFAFTDESNATIESLSLEISVILQDSHHMQLLWVDDSRIFHVAQREFWQISSYSVDKLLGSRRQIQLLWQEYKVLRAARLGGLHLCDRLMNVTSVGNKIYISTLKAEIDLKKLLEMGGHLSETRYAVRALIDAVEELHALGVIHRNLSPARLAINDVNNGVAILKHFSWSASVNDRDGYSALPQNMYCCRGSRWPAGSPAHDLWAVGAIILQMLVWPGSWRAKVKFTSDLATIARQVCQLNGTDASIVRLLSGTVLSEGELLPLLEISQLYDRFRDSVTYEGLFLKPQ